MRISKTLYRNIIKESTCDPLFQHLDFPKEDLRGGKRLCRPELTIISENATRRVIDPLTPLFLLFLTTLQVSIHRKHSK